MIGSASGTIALIGSLVGSITGSAAFGLGGATTISSAFIGSARGMLVKEFFRAFPTFFSPWTCVCPDEEREY